MTDKNKQANFKAFDDYRGSKLLAANLALLTVMGVASAGGLIAFGVMGALSVGATSVIDAAAIFVVWTGIATVPATVSFFTGRGFKKEAITIAENIGVKPAEVEPTSTALPKVGIIEKSRQTIDKVYDVGDSISFYFSDLASSARQKKDSFVNWKEKRFSKPSQKNGL